MFSEYRCLREVVNNSLKASHLFFVLQLIDFIFKGSLRLTTTFSRTGSSHITPLPGCSLLHNQHPSLVWGTFVTTDEPTLIHYHHPKSIVYIGVHLWYTLWFWKTPVFVNEVFLKHTIMHICYILSVTSFPPHTVVEELPQKWLGPQSQKCLPIDPLQKVCDL